MDNNQEQELEWNIPDNITINGVEFKYYPVAKVDDLKVKARELFNLQEELKILRHHQATTIGLWATDKDPDYILKSAKDCSIYAIDVEKFHKLFVQIK